MLSSHTQEIRFLFYIPPCVHMSPPPLYELPTCWLFGYLPPSPPSQEPRSSLLWLSPPEHSSPELVTKPCIFLGSFYLPKDLFVLQISWSHSPNMLHCLPHHVAELEQPPAPSLPPWTPCTLLYHSEMPTIIKAAPAFLPSPSLHTCWSLPLWLHQAIPT